MHISRVITFGAAFGAASGSPLPRERVAASSAPVIQLKQASVKGFTDKSGNGVFLGIPFAATTGGNNRYVSRFPKRSMLTSLTCHPLDGSHLKTCRDLLRVLSSMLPDTVQHVRRQLREHRIRGKAKIA